MLGCFEIDTGVGTTLFSGFDFDFRYPQRLRFRSANFYSRFASRFLTCDPFHQNLTALLQFFDQINLIQRLEVPNDAAFVK